MKKHSQQPGVHIDYTLFSFKTGIVLLFVLGSLIVFAVSQGSKGNIAAEFDQKIIKPFAALFANQTPQQKGLSAPETQEMEFSKQKPTITSTPSPTLTVTPTPTKMPVQVTRMLIPSPKPTVTPFPTYSFQSYEEARRKQDEWFKKVQEENKKKSEESKKALEQFREESLKKFEEFKKQSEL